MRSIVVRIGMPAMVVGVLGVGLNGQQPLTLPPPEMGVPFQMPLDGPTWTQAAPMPPGDVNFEVVYPPLGTDREAVTGAPYSAEAVTEMVQTLADGNRIVRQSTTELYRDGSGRIRREGGLAILGPLVGSHERPRVVSIQDVTAGVIYILDPEARTARKMMPPRFVPDVVTSTSSSGTAAVQVIEESAVEMQSPPVGGQVRRMALRFNRGEAAAPQAVNESLGQRIIEGVEAEGTKSTVTIPSGQIGNEQPIQIVSERWYSPALKVVVESRRSDPRFGETTYKLTRIVRAEPAPSLFEVPADYKLIEEPRDINMFFKRMTPPPGKP